MSSRVVICATLIHTSLSLIAFGKSPEVTGDRSLLDALLSAQETNVAAYPKGALECDATVAAGDTITTAVVSVIWSEKNAYWKYSRRAVTGLKVEQTAGEVIQTGSQRIYYTPGSKLIQISPATLFKLHDELNVLPDQWFQIGDGIPLKKLLDPEFNSDYFPKLTIEKLNEDTVRIRRHSKVGSTVTLDGSLTNDGNIIKYSTSVEEGKGTLFEGEFKWERHESGKFFVRSLRQKRSLAGNASKIDRSVEIKVKTFDPKAAIPPNRFDLDSLKAPPGTSIEEFSADGKVKRNWKIAKKPDTLSDSDLESSASEVRKGRLLKGKNE